MRADFNMTGLENAISKQPLPRGGRGRGSEDKGGIRDLHSTLILFFAARAVGTGACATGSNEHEHARTCRGWMG